MHRHRRRGAVAASLVLGLGLALTACSSSSSTSAPNSGQSTAPAGKLAPIAVGAIGAFSGGTIGPDGAAQLTMLKGWAQSVNSAGGIKGHPVTLTALDDGSNPAGGLDDAKQLVTQDHVVAIIDIDASDSNWTPYVATTGVPVISTETTPSNPTMFPAGSNAIAAIYGAMTIAKTVGPNFGSLFCAEYTECAKGTSLYTSVADAIGGIQVKVAARVSGTQPDYTGPCQQLINAKVNAVQIGEPAAIAQRIWDNCKSLGLDATLIQINGTISPTWLTDAAFNGTRATESNPPFFLDQTPGQKAYRAALNTYLPSHATQDDPATEYPWIAGKLFEQAVENAPSGTITANSIKQGLYAFKGETLGGLAPPLTYVKGQIARINCYYTIGIDSGHWVAPQGNKADCAPDSFVKPIFSIFS